MSSLKETHLRPVLDPVAKTRLLPSASSATLPVCFFVMKSRFGAFLITSEMFVRSLGELGRRYIWT